MRDEAVGGHGERLRMRNRKSAVEHAIDWHSIGPRFSLQKDHARDVIRDNVFPTFLLLGEGLRSTHHKFPTAGTKGEPWKDWNGALLLALERAGVIWNLRRHGAIN